MAVKDLEVLCVGTTCADLRRKSFGEVLDQRLDKILGDGVVDDSSQMIDFQPEWFEYDQNAAAPATGGGTLNIAPLIAKAGANAGILTALGYTDDGPDLGGEFILRQMEESGTLPLIVEDYNHKSSVSFVKPEASGGQRSSILHCPNAVDFFDAERYFLTRAAAELPEGALVHYIYSGLNQLMDRNNSEKAARLIKECRRRGFRTMGDTHTYSANPAEDIKSGKSIAKYRLLRPILPHLDFFFCSEAEAMMIANTFGYKLKGGSQHERDSDFLLQLAADLMYDDTPRILGITAGTTAHLRYLSPGRVASGYFQSGYKIAEANMFVGAGDSFRAGFMLEWAKNKDFYNHGFMKGKLRGEDLASLAMTGHLMAAFHVTRDLQNPYADIPQYEAIKTVVQSGKSFTTRADLLGACMAGK